MERNDKSDTLTKVLAAIAIIGALNWGLVGFFNWNLVDAIFGGGSREMTSNISRFIYAIIGLCGLALAFLLPTRRVVDRTARTTTGVRRHEPTPTPV